jgi:lysozyme
LRFIKANPNDPKIAAEFAKWNRAGGEVSRGLVRRRKKEAELYFTKIV